MKVLIIGSSGMLGKALVREAKFRTFECFGVDLEDADYNINITSYLKLKELISYLQPNLIINTVAIVNLLECENNPEKAYNVNAKPAKFLADLSRSTNAYFIHISTDHFYSGDKGSLHKEENRISLFNEYAKTKYVAEEYALSNPSALIVRTNIIGFRYKENKTFLEWVLDSLENKKHMILFEDFYTSSIDVKQFSKALFDLIDKRPKGVLNLASSEVFSKKRFIQSLASVVGYDLSNTSTGSIFSLNDGIIRAESLGLDVSIAERLLEYKLPNLDQVIQSIVSEFNERIL
ncbi:sugar nucleotide-binding protein [Candidatus Babeliales bacterium]|nr:sugar nucleotide-binding protein [Candidatus Babeliales bacterium]